MNYGIIQTYRPGLAPHPSGESPPLSATAALMPNLVTAILEYFTLVAGLGLLALMCVIWTPIALGLGIFLPDERGRQVGRRAITHAFNLYVHLLSWLGALRVDLSELDKLRTEPPLIIAPNHPSLLDAVLVLSRLSAVGCIVRADRLDHPLLGPGARLAGYIPNHPQLGMIKRAIAELRAGSHLLLFPEGTRTTRTPVNAFRSSPALIACKAGVAVQTVFIETDSPFLGKHWPWFRRPSLPLSYRVRLGRRFAPTRAVRTRTGELEDYFLNELGASRPASRPAPAHNREPSP